MFRWSIGLVGGVAVVLLLIGSAAATSQLPSATQATSNGAPVAALPSLTADNSSASPLGQATGFETNDPLASTVSSVERALTESGRNSATLHPPNLHEAPSLSSTGGKVTPLYSIAPAPMGEGYFGLSNATGVLRATTINTTSLAGIYSTGDPLGTQTEEFDVPTGSNYSEIQPAYDSYGAQLNAVITNVTVFGQTSFYNPKDIDAQTGCPGYDGNPDHGRAPCPNEFWLQNYIEYVPATHAMQIGDEIWNFSNPTANWGSYNPSDPADRQTLVGFGSIADGLYFLTNTPSEYGPTIYVAYPYTLAMYLNVTRGPCHTDKIPGTGVPSCTADGSTVSTTEPVNEIFFNYSVWKAPGQPCLSGDVCQGNHVCPAVEPYAGIVCGEYDDIFFNSVNPATPGVGVPEHGPHGQVGSAAIEANGTAYDPVGLTNDFEFDYGIGSDDGDTNNVVYQNGTVAVDYCSSVHTLPDGRCAAYSAPPAAFDFGGETGETSTGEVDYWAPQATSAGAGFELAAGAPVAHLVRGPSLLTGLWNMSGNPFPAGSGSHALSYAHISPANAWVGVAQGAGVTNQSKFQVAPTFGWFSYWKGSGGDPRGTALGSNLYLPPGEYTIEVLLGGYSPQIRTVDLSKSGQAPAISLVPNSKVGVYTPLWAFSASDLANISTNGATAGVGGVGDPYQLENAAPTLGAPYGEAGSLSWLFSNTNDYLFTVWIGEFLNSTSVYAESNPAASFLMQYPSWQLHNFQFFDVPSSDRFQLYFNHVQHFTLAHTTGIYSWASFETVPLYSVVCYACENVLIADNSFRVSDRGLELLGGASTPPTGAELLNTRNVVWGNSFVPDPQTGFAGLLSPSTALVVRESFDRIYNNAFRAYSSSLRASASAGPQFTDWWNATCQPGYAPFAAGEYPGPSVCEPLSYAQSMNGFRLTGSIIGSNYQGGNFWSGYGTQPNPYANIPFRARTLSYDGAPQIASTTPGFAGDYAPLVTLKVYRVTLAESGLPASKNPTTFAVEILPSSGGAALWANSSATNRAAGGCASNSVCVNFYAPNGAYRFSVSSTKVAGSTYAPVPATGSIRVSGHAPGVITITFAKGSGTATSSPQAPSPAWLPTSSNPARRS